MTTEQQVTTERAGTQKYMAPGILNEDNYNENADVYSFGVLAFTILNKGKLPDMKMHTARNIIDSCWNIKPEERPSFEQILNTLISNKYNIVELNESEFNEVETFVENHKTKIPSY
ncbi:hypothetical protein M9Y10_004298 [Tritrichomonas musculus]|uniref:Protein kinase domain-containing protein n=1 Tax=Tritrichomonas musculus TaxID=1915356 RepID=A0ABR2JUK4_9EUKA